MTDLNSVSLVGRLTKTPELEHRGAADTSVLAFTIAVNRDFKKKDSEEWDEKVSFIDCAVFGRRAEGLAKWLEKGRTVSVEGYLEQDRWEKDGKPFSRLKVVPVRVNPFVGGGKQGDTASAASDTAAAPEEPDIY